MRIEFFAPTLAIGCCPHHLYAIITERDLALCQLTPNVWTMQAYTNTQEFAIWLSEHSTRSFYYYADLSPDRFTLPASSFDRPYTIEFWKTANGTANRSVDQFLAYDRRHWSGSYWEDVRLSESDRASLVPSIVQASLVYDDTESILRCTGWLELNGEVQPSQNFSLQIFDDSGSLVTSLSLDTSLAQLSGIYHGFVEDIAFHADRMYFAVATISTTNQIFSKTYAIPAWD